MVRVDAPGQLHRLQPLQSSAQNGLALSVIGLLGQVHDINAGLPQQRPVQARQSLLLDFP